MKIRAITVANENRFYFTANKIFDLMGISISHAYKLICDMNDEFTQESYIVAADKAPKRYAEIRVKGHDKPFAEVQYRPHKKKERAI